MSEENKNVTRRDFIKKGILAAGIMALVASPIVPLLKARQASASNLSEAKAGVSKAAAASGSQQPRSWTMVIDLKKCDGCVSIGTAPQCTQSCINEHLVPKGMQWIQAYSVDLPGGGSYFMPTPCNHCENAPCVNVCPVGATYQTAEGIVLIDQRRCIGCRFCMAACPYQRRFFNWGTPDQPPQAALAHYTPETEIPAIKGTVMKCNFCPDHLHSGALPACAAGCPMKAIYMGDLNSDVATNGTELVVLSKFLDDNSAYRYKAELGTKPRVWFLPGHGQNFGRDSNNPIVAKPVSWPEGTLDYSGRVSVWPWSKPDKWPWEVQIK